MAAGPHFDPVSPSVSGTAPLLVIASRNPGKVREFRRLLDGVPYRLLSLDEAGVGTEVEENGDSFEENARAKALGYGKATGLLTLADDSGLEVDALDGRPGVRSARYAGPAQTDEEGRARLLADLRRVPGWRRKARYRAVVAVAGPQTGGEVRLFDGTLDGAITHGEIGEGGFGYDPLFWVAGFRKTVGEMTAEEKDAISHRGIAARKAAVFLASLV